MRQKEIKDKDKFQFTRGWFLKRNRLTFVQYIAPEWEGKPITYLELGVFEGMSMVWMMQHILTNPDSRAVGIDPWLQTCKLSSIQMDAVRQRAEFNTALLGERCQIIRANSDEILRIMGEHHGHAGIRPGSLDLCLIDGNHNSLAVWNDARRVYKLLKVGGWMMFDDVENDKAKTDHVKEGLHLFLQEVGDKVKLLWKHRYVECYIKVS